MLNIAVMIYAVLSIIVIIFQISLILGAPLGSYAMGGKYPGVLPLHIRLTEIVQVFLLVFNLSVMMQIGGWVNMYPNSFVLYYRWFVLALSFLAALLNWMTPSVKERNLWGPISTILLLCVLIIIL